jgi:hypothetical protein
MITYYQRRRHIYGRMKLEVFDAKGKLVDTLPASSRRGLSRVEWSMRLKPPVVPPAAVIAGEATIGPRVVPGTYTVKLTRGKEVYTAQLTVGLDPRANFTAADRQLEFDSAMRVYQLFGDLSFDLARINGVRQDVTERAERLPAADPLRQQANHLAEKADLIRKKIVATKEGGAITGEERIREKTSQVYGAVVFYEGRPTDYYLARIDSLTRERKDVVAEFDAFLSKDLQAFNGALAAKKIDPVRAVSREAWDKANSGGGNGAPATGSGLSLHGLNWR